MLAVVSKPMEEIVNKFRYTRVRTLIICVVEGFFGNYRVEMCEVVDVRGARRDACLVGTWMSGRLCTKVATVVRAPV